MRISDWSSDVCSSDLRRGTHKIGLRQGVLRLLNSLGLAHLKPKWDELYSERSTLIHGLAPEPGARYDELANRSVSLCGYILLRVIAREVPAAERYEIGRAHV